MTNNQNKTPQQDYHENAKLGMLALLIGALAISAKEMQIKTWFYNHMIALVLAGFAVIAILGFLLNWRIKKNNKDQIKRMQGLKTVKPQSRQMDYFKPERRRLDE